MNNLKVLVYSDPNTDLEIFENVIGRKDTIDYVQTSSEEQLIQALTAQSFDLLIIDLDLPKPVYKQAQLLADMIYPGAAVIELDLQHSDYIDFKLDQLWQKWVDAHSEGQRLFHDGIV